MGTPETEPRHSRPPGSPAPPRPRLTWRERLRSTLIVVGFGAALVAVVAVLDRVAPDYAIVPLLLTGSVLVTTSSSRGRDALDREVVRRLQAISSAARGDLPEDGDAVRELGDAYLAVLRQKRHGLPTLVAETLEDRARSRGFDVDHAAAVSVVSDLGDRPRAQELMVGARSLLVRRSTAA